MYTKDHSNIFLGRCFAAQPRNMAGWFFQVSRTCNEVHPPHLPMHSRTNLEESRVHARMLFVVQHAHHYSDPANACLARPATTIPAQGLCRARKDRGR